MPKIDLPEGYKPSEDEDYMNPMQLEYFRQKLLSWKEDILNGSRETLEHLREENWHEPDFNDRASVESEAALELRTRDRDRKLLDKIEDALLRVDTGQYGYCEETGEQIGLRRLEARPIATLSIDAQEKHERHENQYNEDDYDD
ncbi:RNA polymerase-binding transcription factor DksA [Rickettsiales bacterium Ac37b]|nr:RNA polymerase-binding transcription factor DksA [Rickettsiales bacterium Ac37b]